MYSWGDDTSSWNKPGKYDFGSAKAPYLESLKKEADAKGSRTYLSKKTPDMKLVNPKGKAISSNSENPIILAVDGTGSMQTWPAEIFDRLPLFYQTLSKYKDDVEVSFSVIGDAFSDDWPLQVSDFGKGPVLDDYLKALHGEGRGGPGIRESYELWAYFMHEHASTQNAISPFMIVMGDEKFYDVVNPDQVKKYLGDGLQDSLDAMCIWKSLAQKYDIRFLRKSYAGRDDEIVEQWNEAIGPQNVIPVYDPMRVVDIAMGLIAKQWGHFEDFGENLSARQDSKNIEVVMESLRAAPDLSLENMNSTAPKPSVSKKSMKLTEV